ncbi:hypothetical protein OCH239_15645 [Roseivivax halodurans JCM 10272]|uniref:Glycosyltransferase 2-like domain-containing protein n=1 Tax=Roseivivax halodurans JCM 10272 TaxID=1449350 RepID=X7EA95_9RHOB|nr:glycosyltransferase [Roseivivax halodurans]ETX12857.1 hypothetical protein OCH239_15645 [Roseivivax halodurans JCM 10272]
MAPTPDARRGSPAAETAIVVPSFDRPQELKECLAHLARLEGGPWRVIVVDDGSTVPVDLSGVSGNINATCIRRANGGPGAARNTGVAAAEGARWILFTDDDCRPRPDWALKLIEAQAGAERRLVGGRIENALPENAYSAASQALANSLTEHHAARGGGMAFFTTNNMCCLRADFLHVGGFDPAFRQASEDRDLSLRWREAGGELVHEAAAIVDHAHRLTLASFWKLHASYGRGARHLHRRLAREGDTRARFEALSFYAGLLARRDPVQAALMGLSQIATTAGYAGAALSEAQTKTQGRMMSDKSNLGAAEPVWCLTCVGVQDDLTLLPHWLRHYLELGIAPERVIVILNAESADAPGIGAAREILKAHGVVRPPEIWIAPYTSGTMWQQRAEAQTRICAPEDWVLNADVDEFQRWPEPLTDCLARAAALGADCVQGVMIDRLARDGTLAPVHPDPHIFEQFPLRGEVAMAIGGTSPVHGRGGTVKIMAARARILPHRGGHSPARGTGASYLYRYPLGSFHEIDDPGFRFSVPTQVDHVHWTESLPARLDRRLTTPGVSPAGAEYGRRQLDHFAANGGGVALDQVTLEGNASLEATDWPGRLAQLRRIGRRKPLTAPLRNRMGPRSQRILAAWRRMLGQNGLRR